MKKISVLIIFTVFTFTAFSQSYNIPSDKPKLVVGITIDGLRYDALLKLKDRFGEDGFNKLIKQGANFKNANYNYLFTQRAPGYSTIVTGSEPSMHGIISDYWYETLKEKSIHAVQNQDYRCINCENSDNACSPENLMISTFSDAIKMYYQNEAKVFSISLDASAAVLSGGFKADAAYWVDDRSGKFVTSSYYKNEIPQWVKKFNKNKYHEEYFQRSWKLRDTITAYKHSLPDSNKYEYGFDAEFKEFPYNYEEIKSHYTGNKFIKMIPEGNTLTTDFSVTCMLEEKLGDDDIPDVLMINYHVSENIGLFFGPDSKEMQDLILKLDKEIAHLANVIEDETGKNNTLFFLTSSSGLGSNPEFRKDEKLPAGRFKHHYVVVLLKSYLNVLYGEGEWIRDYRNQQIFLNRTLIEDSDLDIKEVSRKASRFILSYNGIAGILTSYDLIHTNYTKGLYSKMQNSFHQKRSGDLIIALKPGWIKDFSYTADHNSAYRYDTHVPLIFYGWKTGRTKISRPVNITDIVPSICNMMNIPLPGSVSGIPIEEISR